jgi:hypothetical protein
MSSDIPLETSPRIALPDGDHLTPRKAFAARLGVCEKTVARMNLLTVYLGNVAHIKERAALQDLADRAKSHCLKRNRPRSEHRRRSISLW